MKEIYLCLDVGGTQIKAGAVDREGNPAGELLYFPARAKEEREELLHHFVSVLEEIRIPGDKTAGVRLAFPEPFDYERGICLMQGLDKYDRLYKVNLRQEFTERLGMAPERVRFANDASAYALGEMGFGQAKGAIGADPKAAWDCRGRKGACGAGSHGRQDGEGLLSGLWLSGERCIGSDSGGISAGGIVFRRSDYPQRAPVSASGGGVLQGCGDPDSGNGGYLPPHASGTDPDLGCGTRFQRAVQDLWCGN